MNIALCYVCVRHGKRTLDFAARFIATYHDYPAGYPHGVFVICNGGPPSTGLGLMFQTLPNVKIWPRQNDDGWDISAYIDAAKGPCAHYDAMLCLGESTYFTKPGWMRRFVDATEKWGWGMYGAFSSNAKTPHLNTTGFFVGPAFLRVHGGTVKTREQRYEFEHGKNAFWRRVRNTGAAVGLVTWDGVYNPEGWRKPDNILWRGDQSNLLMRMHHCDDYDNAPMKTKLAWARQADKPFS